ncbi:protealysin inhibitor emfourin [Myxococcus fulvus]|uniref:protealysin inhibitor emfourin n=1 Tax=Myxococcus fulvus TaxID=33 RepID=UPI003B999E7D
MSTRIALSQEGGLAAFPGLARPRSVELDALPAEEARALEEGLRDTRFHELPRVVGGAGARGADRRRYTLTVEEGTRRHTVELVEPVEDPRLRELLSLVKRATRKRRGGDSN